ncbi:MAG: large-conductance mechanosensitive channel protein MscL [Myxococcota bacterium]|nr:large-conductance mechanosensitive channel protein MscL [Myxococcota bacterium]
MGLLDEFKDFAMKGNVVDMAVGVVVGGAFKGVVTSFTNDILMPPIGMLLGGVNFSDLTITIKEAAGDATAVTINHGVFINTVIDFMIVAFAIFMVVKAMNAAMKEEEAAPKPPPGPSTEEVLLTEIRDALRSR